MPNLYKIGPNIIPPPIPILPEIKPTHKLRIHNSTLCFTDDSHLLVVFLVGRDKRLIDVMHNMIVLSMSLKEGSTNTICHPIYVANIAGGKIKSMVL